MNAKHGTWLEITAENRPWTRWWWLGSAVDKETISRLMETYREAGLGGVEITSIYEVRGQEHRTIEYLSPEWLDMVKHTITEANRLGMKVDLPPGSGWRIGGSFVTDSIAAAKLCIEKSGATSGYTAESRPSGEMVKRAGPGGNGRAFNPFCRASLQTVIDHFTPSFKDLDLRAQFHDSWEYQSNSCPEFFDRFREKRGYDLKENLAELVGEGNTEFQARVKYDVQLTLAELALDDFIIPWTKWCHELGQVSRNQAHGSPGNLLDLYAAADIPETEVFRSVTPDTPLLSKFASSAAHVAGKSLVSSETGTWLNEHFHVSLADARRLVDNLFVSGINHHVYHGTAYSPRHAEWPGWLFYASTQFNPQNSIWRDFYKLNEYVTRCQSILQDGKPDNDLLVYFPIHDVLHDCRRDLAAHLSIEGKWLGQMVAADTFRRLWQRGYGFDYISDRQIARARISGRTMVTPGGAYRAIVVPPCQFMPVETLDMLVRLSRQGGHVLFLSPVPADVPGLARLEERRNRFNSLIAEVKGCTDIESVLSDLGVEREQLAARNGLLFIRRRHDSGHYYFLANQGPHLIDEWVPLAVTCQSVLIMDPMSGRTGIAQMRGDTNREIRIQLEPEASCILRTFSGDNDCADAWPYTEPCGPPSTLQGMWGVEFIEGGPDLPADYETDALSSWTDHGEAAERFAGTAVYSIEFDTPSEGHTWQLDLGEVHSSARVRLNGKDIDTLIGPSFNTILKDVRQKGNLLEIEVTNLAANRIRDLDRRGVEWRIFDDVNFCSRQSGPFDASNWRVLASGLLGPVRLQRLG
jgi:hypothetical protein